MGLSVLYAIRALSGKPHRARRATRAALPAFLLLLADGLGRIPVAMVNAEAKGDPRAAFWTVMDLSLRNGVPVLLWGLALLGRWRGWLADTVFATAIVIAAAITVLMYLLPLPGRWPF